uniref:Uncharacterized protein n=1 Tax=Romanomermis culicivorax TaxID=13658 RepID=A0A915KUB6_ROMCU
MDDFLPDFESPRAPAPDGDIKNPPVHGWSGLNPLKRLRFDEPIDKFVSPHLVHDHVSPFKSSNVKSSAAKMFYTSFFLGLLTAEYAKKETGIISMYKRQTVNTLELLVVYERQNGASLHVHEIDFGEAFGDLDTKERDSLDGRRLAAIERKIEGNPKTFSIAEVEVHKYKLVEQLINPVKDKVGFKMILADTYAREARTMDSDVQMDEAIIGPYIPLLEVPLELGPRSNNWRAFYKSLGDFSKINEPNIENIVKTLEKALIPMYRKIRYVSDETRDTWDGLKHRTLEWSIDNAMKNLHHDVLEATEADKAQFKANYDL